MCQFPLSKIRSCAWVTAHCQITIAWCILMVNCVSVNGGILSESAESLTNVKESELPPTQKTWTIDLSLVKPRLNYGEVCEITDDCMLSPHLECVEGTCECKVPKIYSPQNQLCVNLPGDPCSEFEGCIENAECAISKGTCECRPGFLVNALGTQCVPEILDVGETDNSETENYAVIMDGQHEATASSANEETQVISQSNDDSQVERSSETTHGDNDGIDIGPTLDTPLAVEEEPESVLVKDSTVEPAMDTSTNVEWHPTNLPPLQSTIFVPHDESQISVTPPSPGILDLEKVVKVGEPCDVDKGITCEKRAECRGTGGKSPGFICMCRLGFADNAAGASSFDCGEWKGLEKDNKEPSVLLTTTSTKQQEVNSRNVRIGDNVVITQNVNVLLGQNHLRIVDEACLSPNSLDDALGEEYHQDQDVAPCVPNADCVTVQSFFHHYNVCKCREGFVKTLRGRCLAPPFASTGISISINKKLLALATLVLIKILLIN